MRNPLQTRALAIALAIATLAACILALLNLQQENSFEEPTDGISWTETSTEATTGAVGAANPQPGLKALRVPADSPGSRAGVRAGDILLAVNDRPTPRLASLEREIHGSGVWARNSYTAAVVVIGKN